MAGPYNIDESLAPEDPDYYPWHEGVAVAVNDLHTRVAAVESGKAPLESPALTGNPTAPTQSAGNDSTRLATTAFVQAAVAAAGGGGVVGSVLLEVSRTGTSVNLASNSFTTYPLDNIVQNDGGGSYNTTTYIYTVPEDGLYLCLGSIRMQDNSATRSVAVGIATSNADGPFVLWDHMGLVDNTPSGAGVGRSGRQYVRLCRFDENDQVRMFIYSQGATFPTHYQTPVNGGPAGQSMVIMKVAD